MFTKYLNIFSLLFLTCHNLNPELSTKSTWTFTLYSNYTIGNSFIKGLICPNGTNIENQLKNLLSSPHSVQLFLYTSNVEQIEFDTIVPLEFCSFTFFVSLTKIGTYILAGRLLNSADEVIDTISSTFLVIHDKYNDSLPSVIDSSITPVTHAQYIGNTGIKRYPSSSSDDCQARSVWDMQKYKDKVFLGAGDIGINSGPVDIWSFSLKNDSVHFQYEKTIEEEAVEYFRISDDKLVIPGFDSRDGWDFGNYYYYDNSSWYSVTNLPQAIHVFDVCFFKNEIFTYFHQDIGRPGLSESVVYKSSDLGKTWQKVVFKTLETKDAFQFYSHNNLLYIFHAHSSVMVYDGNSIQTHYIPLTPSLSDTFIIPDKIMTFNEGLIYCSKTGYPHSKRGPSLYYLPFDQLNIGAKLVRAFNHSRIVDMLVYNDTCHVLTSIYENETFSCEIFSSHDLVTWQKKVYLKMPALAFSFEYLPPYFFIGLANRQRYFCADTSSGQIYRIDMRTK